MASSSAAMDVDAAVPPLHQDLVQYSFVHMRLEVDWLEYYKVQIDVNFSHQLRIDNGTWHGSADYYFDTHGRDCWNLSFHPEGDTSRRMEHATFRQVLNTYTFLSIEIAELRFRDLVADHMTKFGVAYNDDWAVNARPKHHKTLHIPRQVARDMMRLDCWATERKMA